MEENEEEKVEELELETLEVETRLVEEEIEEPKAYPEATESRWQAHLEKSKRGGK